MDKIYIIDTETNLSYYFSGINQISPTKTASLTEYNTSEGTVLSDHSYKNPKELNFQIMSSSVQQKSQSYYINSLGSKIELSHDSLKNIINHWWEQSVRLNIQTNHELFTNMTVDSISWTEAEDSWNIYNPTLHFKETRVATLKTSTLKALNVPLEADYAAEVDSGEENGTASSSGITTGKVLASVAVGFVGAKIGAKIGALAESGRAHV